MASRPSLGRRRRRRRRRKAGHVPHLLPCLLLVLLSVLASLNLLRVVQRNGGGGGGGDGACFPFFLFPAASAAFSSARSAFARRGIVRRRPLSRIGGRGAPSSAGGEGAGGGRHRWTTTEPRRRQAPFDVWGAAAAAPLHGRHEDEEAAAATATATTRTIATTTRGGGRLRPTLISTDTDTKDDDGRAEENPEELLLVGPPPPRLLDGLDEFMSALHEALRIAASRAQGRDEVEEGGGNDPDREEEAAAAAAAFQSLAIDFVYASSSRKKIGSTGGSSSPPPSPPPPGPGSLKRITGRLVRLPPPPDRNIKTWSARSRRRQLGRSPTSACVLHVTYKYRGATDIVKNYPVEEAAHTLKELLNWWRQRRMTSSMDDDDAVPAAVSAIATEWGVARLVPATTATTTVKGRIDTAHGRHVLTLPALSASRGAPPPPIWSFRPAAPAARAIKTNVPRTSAALEHDRMKDRRVRIEDDFWRAVGVTTTTGLPSRSAAPAAPARPVVKPDKIAKVKQCEKFVEIVTGLLLDVAADAAGAAKDEGEGLTTTTGPSEVRITDLGCGKGYLTYALHSYLQQQQLYENVTSIGVDLRPKLVHELNHIVSTLGIEGLRFEQGSIQDACLGGDDGHDAAAHDGAREGIRDGTAADAAAVQVAIALHACDTATDDALHVALQRNADVIVTAPCCHKQLRPQINDLIVGGGNSRRSSNNSHPHPLSDVLRHGIYRERTTETVTDSLRALLMELAGYDTRVFEFVGGEHTAKNCMITGVRRHEGDSRSRQEDRDAIRDRVRSLAAFYGVRAHKLADWMGEQALLLPQTHDADTDSTARRSMRTMPPL